MLYLPAMKNMIRQTLLRLFLATVALAVAAPAAAQSGEEVPFVTSPDNVTLEMLRSARVGPRDHVIDLGSGDGRIVILAAKRFGASGLGVEIVPDLVRQSNENAQRAGVSGRAKFLEQDLFKTDLSQASVITMYLLAEVNMDLRPRLLHYMNTVGFFGWWLNSKMQRQEQSEAQIATFDNYVVPVMARLEGWVRPPFGQSLFAVLEKP